MHLISPPAPLPRRQFLHPVFSAILALIVSGGALAQPTLPSDASPASASPSSATAPDRHVTFVSYNLKNYLPMPRRVDGESLPEAPKPEKEIAKLIEFIVATKPDILGICEIGRPEDAADLQSRLAKEGISLEHIEFSGGGDTTRRLALLSRFPIVARNSQSELTYVIGKQTIPFQRGILDATVEISPQYRVRFLGTHLKSKREIPGADQSLMRRNEAALLRKHIDSILEKSPKENLMVYGDFNDTLNETPVREIVGRFGSPTYLTPLRLTDANDESWTYFWSYADLYSRIDFVCASKGLLPEINRDASYIFSSPDWFDASDHRPLVLKIIPEERDR